ncbi:hypothetical protein GCM10011297_11510 [Bacterioplanes sanyensis]|uniref:transglutaminase-like domain-containing protein n=1 Tax=Bacterioplanes sanyensis TaxID=1249553 RepID=UPI00167502EB|nr:transglutaminase-like domain-containing protein [Bacterioplanes sanyensis]GGY39889.1 hypothetical protein GCM10011297_11510 [Bacterioplanes sanyensis]
MTTYLNATEFFDFDHPQVQAYGRELITDNVRDPIAIAQRLYLAVRDDIRYNPYVFSPQPHTFRASDCLLQGQSYCIPKAVLLGALARMHGIPARLGLADVRNHLSSPQLLEFLRSDVFVMHGYIELYLNERWVKATPAFNAALCAKMRVEPLAFNGVDDSVFQAFNGEGESMMEYLQDHGTFVDVPVDFIVRSVAKAYPHLMATVESGLSQHSLEHDLKRADATEWPSSY